MKAYLKVKYLEQGIFSSERIIEVISSSGETYQGIFQDCHMNGDSLVNVDIMDESKKSYLVKAMHGEHCRFYGYGVDGYPYLTVDKEQVLFEGMEEGGI